MVVPRQQSKWLALAFSAFILASCGSQQGAVAPSSTEAVALASTTTEPAVTSSTTSSSTTSRSTSALVPECVSATADEFDEPPPSAAGAVQQAAANPAFGSDVGISIWVDGWGEIVTVNPDLQLEPASNQKLLVAIAAHDRLDIASHFRTRIELVGSNLVLRAGGDPTLTSANIDDLIRQVVANGVTSAERLVIDVAAYPQPPRATGWLDWQLPTYVGPLSGLMIDDNRWSKDEAFVSDPVQGNGERILERMSAGGLTVADFTVGVTVSGIEDELVGQSRVIAEHESATFDDLVRSMLLSSDNQTADLLLMELGRDASGEGTLNAGAAVVDAVLAELCVENSGTVDDGSGLSRDNQRSARELQELLRVVRGTPTGERTQEQLPVGGVSGTLANRFSGSVGRVAAKTGTIIGGRSLSGYATTDSGRDVVFSIIVNGEPELANASLGAIDQLVTTMLRISE